MFQVIFIIAVVLVVPVFFLFSWLMSRCHARKKVEREQRRGNSKDELANETEKRSLNR